MTLDKLREAHEQVAGLGTHPATQDYIAALEQTRNIYIEREGHYNARLDLKDERIAAQQQRIAALEKALAIASAGGK